MLINVACSKAKSQQLRVLREAPLVLIGDVNAMLSRVLLTAYESVVLWVCELATVLEFAFVCAFIESRLECSLGV